MTWVVHGVPIDCLGASSIDAPGFGTELAPDALRRLWVPSYRGPAVTDHGNLDVRIAGSQRDPASGLVGGASVAQLSQVVRSAVRDTVNAGDRSLLLGGCCTLLPGALAGVRDAYGDVALLHLDGHLDLYDPASSPTGEAADMPIAVSLGRGDARWLEAIGPPPLLTIDRMALVGHRDPDEARTFAAELAGDLAPAVSSAAHVRSSPEDVGRAAGRRLSETGAPTWVHLDLDVLDRSAFPATDYLMPDGPDVDQLLRLVNAALRELSPIGVSVACYNPEKDLDGSGGAIVTRLLSALTSGSAPEPKSDEAS